MKTKAITLVLFVFGIGALLILSGMMVNSGVDMVRETFSECAKLQIENEILKDKLGEAEQKVHRYEKAIAYFAGDGQGPYDVDVFFVPNGKGGD